MKGELLHSLKSRIEEKKELSLVTFHDPRFKDNFSGNIIKATIKEMVLEEMSTLATESTNVQNAEAEGPTRPKRFCPLNSCVLLDVFSEIVAESNEEQPASSVEVDIYLSMPIIDFKSGNPYYLWWSQHSHEFLILSKLA